MLSISGITIVKDSQCFYIAVENFSEELQELMRSQLASVFNGFANVENLPEIYSYKRTLKSFLDRYNDKSEDTKKGMIGELLAHILIGNYFEKFTSLSVLKNKEERSIKKGFDIIYHNVETAFLWYSEVKSGRSGQNGETSTQYNDILLDRSYNGITEMFASRRQSLWESALTDVLLTIKESKKQADLSNLLDADSPEHNSTAKKNVILISVLYNCPTEPIEMKNVKSFFDRIKAEDKYADAIVISIQKKLFEKVASFLQSEASK